MKPRVSCSATKNGLLTKLEKNVTNDSKPKTYKPGEAMVEELFWHDPKKKHLAPIRNRDKTYFEGPIEVLRGIQSTDPLFLQFKDRLSVTLTSKLPASVDEDGKVTGNGVRSNFYGLRYVGGYPQIPATYPLVDNTHLRTEKGLLNEWEKPWHKTCAQALVRLFFRDIEPVPMKLRTNSSSMMPFYTKDMAYKKDLALHSIRNGEKAARMMMAGDYRTPWTEYYVGGAYHTVYRRQASDAMTREKGVFKAKDRPVADLEFALTGGRSGKFVPSNRNLVLEDVRIPEGFFRERNRTAMGGPLGLNANLMIIAQAVRKHIYHEYDFTYHHTTRSSQQEQMRGMGVLIAADVSNHDWYWATFVVDTMAEELLNLGYADWWVHLFKIRFKLPNYVTDVAPGEGNILLGSWTEPNNNGGLPSGNSFTDLDGCFLMTLVYFIMQVEHTYPELISQLQSPESAERTLSAYLKGKLPISLKDKSDDAVLGWPDTFLHGRAHALQEKMKAGEAVSPYMIVSYEHGGAFLGSVLLYPTTGQTSGLTLIGNANSLVTNQFSPEYGVQSNLADRSKAKRPYAGLAWKTLAQNYGTAPAFSEIMEITEFEFSRTYGFSYAGYREEWLRDDERKLMDDLAKAHLRMPDLTPIDIEVLLDPSRADWKYAGEDVSTAITDLLFNGIPLETIEPYFKAIYPHV